MSTIWPNLRTPPLDHPALADFAREICPGDVESAKLAAKLGPIGNCYWNVQAAVDDRGGGIQLGWQVLLWPNRFLSAMHHAVWRKSSGRLLDLTEHYPSDPVKARTVFIQDNSISIDLTRLPVIENRLRVLDDRPEVHQYIEARRQKHDCEQRRSALRWECGNRCNSQIAMARGRDEPPFFDRDIFRQRLSELQAIEDEYARLHRGVGIALTALKALDASR